mmetsp:Transcript_37783/g.87449  ORF Transcript_37783/g.87449 Transcript_37783/m.87449 type:complete len:392 (-) Transcript_37783:72-1247(-)
MDPKIILSTLSSLDDNILSTVMGQLLQQKPELAPGLVSMAVPDLTYAPTKAFTERRCSGTVKKLNPQMGMGAIDCPELNSVFGCDVLVHAAQVGQFLEGTEVNFAVTLNDDNKPQAFDLQENTTPSMPSMGAMPGMMAGMPGAEMGAGLPGMDMGLGPLQGLSGLLPLGPGGGNKAAVATANQEILGEFYGIVKSYNAEKGFGFIVCDALRNQHDGDVYLHNRHIGDFKVGQEVKFQAYLHNGRLQGRDLQDATGLVGPQTGAAPSSSEEQELGVFVGRIKHFHPEKGFGFIVCEALNMQGYQGDVFLHNKHKDGFQAGDEVAFMAVLRNGKLQGRDLQPASTVIGEAMGDMMSGMMGGMMGGVGMMGGPGMMGGMMGGGMESEPKRARMY